MLERFAEQSPRGNTIVGFFSDLESQFGLPQGANDLLPCFYHWFGVSAANFARQAAYCRGVQEGEISRPPYSSGSELRKVSVYCSNYVDSISELSSTRIWRNKVFAHFSNTDPRGSDNVALLQQVSFYPMPYSNGRLIVGGFQLFSGFPDARASPEFDRGHGSGLPSWSLTETFEALMIRYEFSTIPAA